MRKSGFLFQENNELEEIEILQSVRYKKEDDEHGAFSSLPICKLKFKMQTAVREDLLRYLQSGKAVEEK